MSDAKYHRPAWVSVLTDTALSSIERVVLAYLVWRQGRNGSAWPSQRTIAQDLGLTCDGVRKITQRLESKGRLTIERPAHTAPGRLLRYQVVKSQITQTTVGANTPTAIGVNKQNHPDGCLGYTPTAVGANTPTAISRNTKGNTKRTLQGHTSTTSRNQKSTWGKPFTPPTPREVEDYAESLGYTNFHNGQAFVDYYAPRGWRDTKGQAVRDWKTKLRNVWLKDLRKPQRGDPDWLPTEEEADAIYAECANTN